MKIHYTKDQNGKDILCDESGDKQVMMEWEMGYMKECIKRLQPKGHVLEIGFGFGYSAEAILTTPGVTEYTVIECSPEVWDRFEKFRTKYDENIKIHLVRGRWQDVLYTLGTFDSCFFDDYDYTNKERDRFEKFEYEFMKNNAIIGTRLGYYSTCEKRIGTPAYLDYDTRPYTTEIPEHCRYAKSVFIPVVTKISNNVTKPNPNPAGPQGIVPSGMKAFSVEYVSHWDRARATNPSNLIVQSVIVIDNFYCNSDDMFSCVTQENIQGNTWTQSLADILTGLSGSGSRVIPLGDQCGAWVRNPDMTPPKIETSEARWVGVVFCNKLPPLGSGIQTFTRNPNKKSIDFNDVHSSFYKMDFIQARMNRLVLIPGSVDHMIIDNIPNALTQRFYFS